MTDHEKRIRERIHGDDSLYTNVRNGELRALLADLDAVRGAAKKLVDAVNYKAAAMAGFADPEKIDFANECVWNAVDQTIRALKGASHD